VQISSGTPTITVSGQSYNLSQVTAISSSASTQAQTATANTTQTQTKK
jgi:hypothetical protein